MKPLLPRREALRWLGAGSVGAALGLTSAGSRAASFPATSMMRTRPIPSSGEALPVVGLGSWLQFDVGASEAERAPLRAVLAALAAQGGRLIDSSPMYGRAEEVIGDLTADTLAGRSFFYATKVWTTGEQSGLRQLEASLRKLRRPQLDLIQVHNLVDWPTQLRTLDKWKAAGKLRYTGITHYTDSAHAQLEQVLRQRPVDFLQVNYSILSRHAEQLLLPAAQERGVAVIINEPFDKGRLFGLVKGRALPPWAADYDLHSWAQFFLKFILSHPAVTCVIPGTSEPRHAADNLQAGFGALPDAAGRAKMVALMEGM